MRRLVAVLVVVVLTAACGGAREDSGRPPQGSNGPTSAELAYREKLVQKIEQGDYTCYCTGALRASERAEKEDP
jgi:hypothetical protein